MDMMMQMLQVMQATTALNPVQDRAGPNGNAGQRTGQTGEAFQAMLREKQQAGERSQAESSAPDMEQQPSDEEPLAEMAAALFAGMMPLVIAADPEEGSPNPLTMAAAQMVMPQVGKPQITSATLLTTAKSALPEAAGLSAAAVSSLPEVLQALSERAEGTLTTGATEAAIPQIPQEPAQTVSLENGLQAEANGSERQNEESPKVTVLTGERNPQPLFQQLEHMPVKVGDAPQLDIASPEFDTRVANTVTEALQRGFETVELKLSPENLGSVTVSLSKGQDGVLHVALAAESEHTLRLLTEHTANLSSLLQSSGQSEVRVDIRQTQENQQQQQPWQQPDSNRQGSGDGQNRRQNQEQQHSGDGFIQQLRLGLLDLDGKE